ncbi:MAG: hypothetical protein E7158_04680 [Firmicutes bacterium]|nr:hypothetical protein [Bacillota bacterium]
MIDYQDIYNKFENNVLKRIDVENVKKILMFLSENGVNCIEDIVNNYIDILIIDYENFINKYNELDIKYNNKLNNMINENMEILELFL